MTALAFTAANVKKISGNALVKAIAAGVTVTDGDVVTVASNAIVLADNDTSPLSTDATIYLALGSGAAGQSVPVVTTGAIVDLGLTGYAGQFFYLGDSGDLIPEADLVTYDFVTQVGYFNDDDYFVVNIIQTGVQL